MVFAVVSVDRGSTRCVSSEKLAGLGVRAKKPPIMQVLAAALL
jgi:hypothetical protein